MGRFIIRSAGKRRSEHQASSHRTTPHIEVPTLRFQILTTSQTTSATAVRDQPSALTESGATVTCSTLEVRALPTVPTCPFTTVPARLAAEEWADGVDKEEGGGGGGRAVLSRGSNTRCRSLHLHLPSSCRPHPAVLLEHGGAALGLLRKLTMPQSGGPSSDLT